MSSRSSHSTQTPSAGASLPSVLLGAWSLLTSSERYRAAGVCLLVLVGMVLEMLGVGLLIPAVALLIRPSEAGAGGALSAAIQWLGKLTGGTPVVAALGLLLCVYLLKALFMCYMIAHQTRFVFSVQTSMSIRLVSRYMWQPWTFHMQRNSAELIRNAQGEVANYVFVLTAMVNIITDCAVAVGLVALVMYTEPLGALLVLLSASITGLAFGWALRHRIESWGARRQHHDFLRLKVLQEGLGAIREAILRGRQGYFIQRYSEQAGALGAVQANHGIVQQLPRVLLELLGVAALASVAWLMWERGGTAESIVPTLAMFGAAASRLLPAFTRIISSTQMIRWGAPLVSTLRSELYSPGTISLPRDSVALGKFDHLELQGVSYVYPGSSTTAIHDVSLRVERGQALGIIGPSGGGKSTLLDLMLGLIAPTAGSVRINDKDLSSVAASWQSRVGYVSQSIFLLDDSLRRNIAFGVASDSIDEAALVKAVRGAQLEEFVRNLPRGLETEVGERGVRLSGGQRQRIGLARALYFDPEVLVLDEATSALDTRTEQEVMSTVRGLRGERTIIIVAHRVSTVEMCHRICKLDGGAVTASGTYATVIGPLRE